MKVTKIPALKGIANKVRLDIIQEIYYAKSGHPGGSLSIADVLTVLYFNEMNIDPEKAQYCKDIQTCLKFLELICQQVV